MYVLPTRQTEAITVILLLLDPGSTMIKQILDEKHSNHGQPVVLGICKATLFSVFFPKIVWLNLGEI